MHPFGCLTDGRSARLRAGRLEAYRGCRSYILKMKKWVRNRMTRLEGRCLRELTRETHKGIRLCDINHDKSDDPAFFARTKEAIDLIAGADPRRFKRVQAEIRFIVNKELNSAGEYRRATRCCFVDFGRYPFQTSPGWYLLLYAGTIVHEATHGALYTRGFLYTPDNREQIERICHAEQQRFFALAKPAWREHLVNQFDPSRWHFAWHSSRWAKLTALFQRIKESKRKANKTLEVSVASAPQPQG